MTDNLHLLTGGAVGNPQHKLDAEFLPLGVVDDGCVAQQIVGHIHQFLIKGADTGAAECDFFHNAFYVVGGNPITDYKGTLRNDDKAAEYIGQGIFGGKGDGHGADTQGSHKGGNIIVPFVGNQDDAEHNAHHMRQGGDQFANGLVDMQTGAFQQLHNQSVTRVAQVVQAPDETDDQAAAQDLVKNRVLGKGIQGT